ncbi:Solute carrier family 35 member G1 [Holothuria leucospilota]|uniref:Solute carrier family 35 member G1 n=1 Tax=Holothuria leucospilota TaxID=206669 RepID=A0A9Q1BYC5_HOLLE|nr:Solute carrier family 35 member G1 [Holothuria leucospilota]
MGNNDESFDNPGFTFDDVSKDKCKYKREPTTGDSKSEVVCNTSSPNGQENEPLTKRVLQETLSVLRGHSDLFLVTFSALLYSVKSLFTAFLVETMDPFQVVVMLMPVMLTGSSCFLVYKKICPPKNVRLYAWMLFGSLLVSATLFFYSLSLLHMDPGDATTILYASLMFTGILSWIILREPLRLSDFVNVSIAFAGVVFICRPPFIFGTSDKDVSRGRNILLGSCFALSASFNVALLYTVVRKQSTLGIHAFVSMFCSAIVVTLSNVIICSAVGGWQIPGLKEWAFATGGGFSYFGAQSILFFSLSEKTSTYVNIVMTSEIVFTFLLQFMVLNLAPPWTSYIGAVLVFISFVGVALSKKRDQAVVN